ncbi:hypothetical protein R1sor_011521 [Riccia sorocarpa]|uniref:PGG domain-containing protein n=1 Tax=Riccia sorocarpa TaxID=122646 RepID=A0ABD3I4Z7_9MARC
MAETQCHQAINSALASFIWDVRLLLGNDHPYRSYTTPSDEKISGDSQVPPGSDHDDSQVSPGSDNEGSQVPLGFDNEDSQVSPVPERPVPKETLRGYVRKYFPDPSLEKWLSLDESPDNTSGGGTMADSSQMVNRSSEFHSHPLIVRQWMVTAPFLPLSEYLFLESQRTWGDYELQVGLRQDKDRLLSLGQEIMLGFYESRTSSFGVEISRQLGVSFFKYLMDITDTRRTAFHYGLISALSWVDFADESPIYKLFVNVHKVNDSLRSPADDHFCTQFDVCFNTRDGSGRTLSHIILASETPEYSGPDYLYFEETVWAALYYRFEWNVLWNYTSRPWYFNQKSWCRDVKSVYEGNGLLGLHGWENWQGCWSSFPLSAEKIVLTSAHLSDRARRTVLVGDTATAELLAKDNRMYDSARIPNDGNKKDQDSIYKRVSNNTDLDNIWELVYASESSLGMAAKHADPEMLRTIADTGKFDPHHDDRGYTILHSAVRCQELSSVPVMWQDFVDILKIHMHLLSNLSAADGKDSKPEHADKLPCQSTMKMEQRREKSLDMESGRQGCVNYLIQLGLDVWETDKHNRIADPGPQVTRGYKTWWYDKLVQETQDQKANFGAAANALSVTAALVATASYVGPLQPPLGLNFVDEDQNLKVLVDVVPIRIFIVCNNLAFFFALVAIMLSLTPSLPMPKESMLEELKRMRRSITLALIALITSITTILMAFASAIIVVIPNKGSWNHGWLSMGTLVVGGPMCLFVLFLCCIRAVKLLFHNNFAVRRFYKRTVFI